MGLHKGEIGLVLAGLLQFSVDRAEQADLGGGMLHQGGRRVILAEETAVDPHRAGGPLMFQLAAVEAQFLIRRMLHRLVAMDRLGVGVLLAVFLHPLGLGGIARGFGGFPFLGGLLPLQCHLGSLGLLGLILALLAAGVLHGQFLVPPAFVGGLCALFARFLIELGGLAFILLGHGKQFGQEAPQRR